MGNKIEAVSVQVIITTYDEVGRPVREQMSTPIKIFRAASENFWEVIDSLISQNGNAQIQSRE